MTYRDLCLWGASTFALLASTPALAQQTVASEANTASTLQEVVVTAEKRPENVQDVPLSIVAMSAQKMQAQGVQDAIDLTRVVPNLNVAPGYQSTASTIQIRGFGTNGNNAIEPSVADYIDNVYIPHSGAILTSFLDLQSVEVLRGPQGTLFGRNTTAGAISIHTFEPANGFSARLAAQAGNFGSYQADGFINVPVTSDLALRFAALANTTEGFIHNQQDGKTYGKADNAVMRLSAKWTPNENITWIGRADYGHTGGDGVPLPTKVDFTGLGPTQIANFTRFVGGNLPTIGKSNWDVNQVFEDPNVNDRQWGISSDLSWKMGGGYSFRLIDSYREWKNNQRDGDDIFLPLSLLYRDGRYDSRSQSHELQFISPKGALLDGKLDFVAGVYYYHENYNIGEILNLGSQFCSVAIAAVAPPLVGPCNGGAQVAAATNTFAQSATSYAGYIQVNYAITPSLQLVLGGRETHDKKTGSFVQTIANPVGTLLRAPENDPNLSFSDTQPTWRAGLNWHINPDVMAFLTYATGYKSGGLNSVGASPPLTPSSRVFQAETADDWELGVKSEFFEHTLLFNLVGYRTTISNFQDRAFVPQSGSFIIRNAGGMRSEGVEIESQLIPEQHLGIDLAVAYRKTYYTSYPNAPTPFPACTGKANSCPTIVDLTGAELSGDSKWSGDVGAQYKTDPFAGGYTASLRADVSFRSGWFGAGAENPQGWISAFGILGGRIALTSPDSSWTLSLVGQNITNHKYYLGKVYNPLDSIMGVRNVANGYSLIRPVMGPPRTWYFRLEKQF